MDKSIINFYSYITWQNLIIILLTIYTKQAKSGHVNSNGLIQVLQQRAQLFAQKGVKINTYMVMDTFDNNIVGTIIIS